MQNTNKANKTFNTNFNLIDDSYVKEKNSARNSLMNKINQKSYDRNNREREVLKIIIFIKYL